MTDPVPLSAEELGRLEELSKEYAGDGFLSVEELCQIADALPVLLHEVQRSRQELRDAVTILDHCKMLDGSYQVGKREGKQLRVALGIEAAPPESTEKGTR